MNNPEIIEKIIHSIHLAQKNKISYEVIQSNALASEYQHEFLFFIKPEITVQSESINLSGILDLVFEKLEQFKLQIKDIRMLTASYLERFDIIARHYGVINALSRKPYEFLSKEAAEKFKAVYGLSPEKALLVGSIEFLQQYPGHTPFSLDELWQNCKSEKLAGGTYCAVLPVEGKNIYLINGFHPKQLIHFTEQGRSIIAFTLAGELDWAVARNAFIGKTNPSEAVPGSLRNELFMRKLQYGLQTVSSSQNGFHLSAGPVEGLAELMRYCSDFSKGEVRTSDDFVFGQQLDRFFKKKEIELICSNQLVEHQGEKIRTFDLTEEKNSADAIQLLRESIFI
jgi:hypothetical protein